MSNLGHRTPPALRAGSEAKTQTARPNRCHRQVPPDQRGQSGKGPMLVDHMASPTNPAAITARPNEEAGLSYGPRYSAPPPISCRGRPAPAGEEPAARGRGAGGA